MTRMRGKSRSSVRERIGRLPGSSMPPPSVEPAKMRVAERPTAGHAGSEVCGEVVRPGGVCRCGTTRVRLLEVGVLGGKNQAFSPGQPLRSRNPPR